MNAEFWLNLLKPIPTQTPVTPTLSVLKLVTPLCLILSSWAPNPVSGYLFALAVMPVLFILLQIAYLTIFKLDTLQNEYHIRQMKELEGLYGDQTSGRKRSSRISTESRGGNPKMNTAPATTIDATKRIEGDG